MRLLYTVILLLSTGFTATSYQYSTFLNPALNSWALAFVVGCFLTAGALIALVLSAFAIKHDGRVKRLDRSSWVGWLALHVLIYEGRHLNPKTSVLGLWMMASVSAFVWTFIAGAIAGIVIAAYHHPVEAINLTMLTLKWIGIGLVALIVLAIIGFFASRYVPIMKIWSKAVKIWSKVNPTITFRKE